MSWGVDTIRALGRRVINGIGRLGHAVLFLVRLMPGLGVALARGRLIIQQLYMTGVLTLVIVLVSGAFVGMILALQGYNTLVRYDAQSSLGLLVALSLVRELGPVLTALLFAGRAGSALTAEIGLMKATEQLDGMEMMAVDPLPRVVAPRFWAGWIAVPLLAMIFSAVGIIGAYIVAVGDLGLDGGVFWSQMQSGVSISNDIMGGLIKSVVFGFVVSWIAVFEGYDAKPTSEGVSRATTRTVVSSSLAILGLDFIMTAFMLRGL
ncbi:lipid asymmetry maintenance ABC transporter permease subunit MlaE [Acidiferrobacter sp.]|uniref:lipid asymmetry maintenance ABC transporter permease subunit MlaE n=1 Tax=Acidiferrobacter sp. TaxID=1872107 RepID=UPI002605BFD1|nr:lipid asymmetry maintenance ABC transporter permease subunit MlaE [Acidiferrobacter sp.]